MRLGVFGGTFDPPHIGHLIVAQDALVELDLDRVVFVPAGQPPHKRNEAITAAGIRLSMVRAAVAGTPGFAVDDIETRRVGPSWMVDTLRAISRRMPDAELYLLIGSDQYAEFDTWHEPAEIRRLARIVVLTRDGESVEPQGARALRVTRIDLSATEIRRRVRSGKPIRYLVPDSVEALIRLNGLYGDPAAGREEGSAGGRTGMAPAG